MCMRKFYSLVVRNPKKILALFVLLAIAAAFCAMAVEVNYNVTDYLPPDTPSTAALEKLESEFSGRHTPTPAVWCAASR